MEEKEEILSPSSSDTNSRGKELNESLIKFSNIKRKAQNEGNGCCRGCLESIFPCMKHIDTVTKRHVFFSDRILNRTDYSNEILNHKYNFISFIPVVLFNQFNRKIFH